MCRSSALLRTMWVYHVISKLIYVRCPVCTRWGVTSSFNRQVSGFSLWVCAGEVVSPFYAPLSLIIMVCAPAGSGTGGRRSPREWRGAESVDKNVTVCVLCSSRFQAFSMGSPAAGSETGGELPQDAEGALMACYSDSLSCCVSCRGRKR